jgi:hypothetical protein
MSALCQKQTSRLYSTTSSTRVSSEDGTVRPSALAVLRLITNSYLVGAWTGRLAGIGRVTVPVTCEGHCRL